MSVDAVFRAADSAGRCAEHAEVAAGGQQRDVWHRRRRDSDWPRRPSASLGRERRRGPRRSSSSTALCGTDGPILRRATAICSPAATAGDGSRVEPRAGPTTSMWRRSRMPWRCRPTTSGGGADAAGRRLVVGRHPVGAAGERRRATSSRVAPSPMPRTWPGSPTAPHANRVCWEMTGAAPARLRASGSRNPDLTDPYKHPRPVWPTLGICLRCHGPNGT